MFDKFYKVDISRYSNIEGLGLGLAISKKSLSFTMGRFGLNAMVIW